MFLRRPLSIALLSTTYLPLITAQIFTARAHSCLDPLASSSAPVDQQLNFKNVYAQFDQGQSEPGQEAHGFDWSTRPTVPDENGNPLNGTGNVLRVVLTGFTNATSEGYSNATGFLSTVDLNTQILSFPIYANQSALCSSIRTATGTTTNSTNTVNDSGCPYGPGDIAVGLAIPLGSSYQLATISTQLVVLDPSVPPLRLACYNLDFTPYYPSYFVYPLIRYLIVGLLAAYLLLYLLARLYSSHSDWIHEHQTQLATSLTLKLSAINDNYNLPKRKIWGTVWYGAWAGRQLIGSGSLRRFLTAELREIWQTVMWWSLVGTVAVDWPGFAYPVFQRTAWTALVYNNTLPFTNHAPPLLPSNFTPPATFATQMADVTSPLYLNSTLPNVLLDAESAPLGIPKWARVIGVKSGSLWSICAFTFFAICAAAIVIHAVCYLVDAAVDKIFPTTTLNKSHKSPGNSPRTNGVSFNTARAQDSFGSVGKQRGSEQSTRLEESGDERNDAEYYEEEGLEEERVSAPRPEDDFPNWQLHLSLLHGNLVRVLMFFHLPLTLFSIYQITLFHTCATSTLVLAILTLVVVSVAIPIYLLVQVHRYDIIDLHYKLPILLSLGPLYNTYSEECSMFSGVRFASNCLVGALIGGAQTVGTAQAAVILLVEVADTLVTSLWLPWGDNSAMGPLAFILSISRIIVAVLLVVLSPSVDVSDSAAAWLAYIIFLVQGLVLLLLFFVLFFKIAELFVRLVGNVPFDENRSARVGGLFGAMRRWDRGGRRKKSGGRAAHGTTAARRRQIQERRMQRNGGGVQGSESSTVDTRTRMLREGQQQQRPPRQSRESSAMSMSSSYGDGLYRSNTGPINSFGEDDGYIMSAMSSGPWTSSPPVGSGYVKPGSYASTSPQQQPVLRSTNWGEATIVSPALPTVQSSQAVSGGFARVGGGRATSGNPYQLANSGSYPSSSADLYSSPHVLPGNPRRLSQSAEIELAAAAPAPPADNLPRHGRTSLTLPPSTRLLSNTTPYPPRSPIRRLPPKPTGFFGRFKKNKRAASGELSSEDDFSEDDTDDEESTRRPAKKSIWPVKALFGGKSEEPAEEPVAEEDTGEKGFSVTRKPRPRAQQQQQQSADFDRSHSPVEELAPNSSAPHVSIEPPSRPTSLHDGV